MMVAVLYESDDPDDICAWDIFGVKHVKRPAHNSVIVENLGVVSPIVLGVVYT